MLLVGTHPNSAGCSPEQKGRIASVFHSNTLIKKYPMIRNIISVCGKTRKGKRVLFT